MNFSTPARVKFWSKKPQWVEEPRCSLPFRNLLPLPFQDCTDEPRCRPAGVLWAGASLLVKVMKNSSCHVLLFSSSLQSFIKSLGKVLLFVFSSDDPAAGYYCRLHLH